MGERKSFGEQVTELVLWAVFMYLTVRLFQRRLTWLGEKVYGFCFFFLVSCATIFFVVDAFGGMHHDDNQNAILVNQTLDPVLFYWIPALIGALWVVYSVYTWQDAHSRATQKALAAQKLRKARNRSVVREYLADVLPNGQPAPAVAAMAAPKPRQWVSPDGRWEWVEGSPVRERRTP